MFTAGQGTSEYISILGAQIKQLYRIIDKQDPSFWHRLSDPQPQHFEAIHVDSPALLSRKVYEQNASSWIENPDAIAFLEWIRNAPVEERRATRIKDLMEKKSIDHIDEEQLIP